MQVSDFRRLVKISSKLLDSDITNEGDNLFTLIKDLCKYEVSSKENDFELKTNLDDLINNTLSLLARFDDMKKVQSSNVSRIGYIADKKRLLVEFKTPDDEVNSIYLYEDVGKDLYNQFLTSNSKGRYFHKNIRGNYKCIRII